MRQECRAKLVARAVLMLGLAFALQGCVGAVVGTAVDVAIEVVKVPFKVGAAVVDVATSGGSDKKAEPRDERATAERK